MRKTFRNILKEVKTANGKKLWKKAQIASRIAKDAKGKSKRSAYAVKTEAVLTVLERMPDRTKVMEQHDNKDFALVKFERSFLHIPVRD